MPRLGPLCSEGSLVMVLMCGSLYCRSLIWDPCYGNLCGGPDLGVSAMGVLDLKSLFNGSLVWRSLVSGPYSTLQVSALWVLGMGLPLLIWGCHGSASVVSGTSVSPFSLGWTSAATRILPHGKASRRSGWNTNVSPDQPWKGVDS